MTTDSSPDASEVSAFRGDFGEVLRALRKSRGLEQVELAAEVHVSAPTISRWENSKLPKRHELGMIRNALNLSAAEHEALMAAWERGVLENADITGLHLSGHGLPFVCQTLENSIEIVRQLRHQGQPQLGYRIADSGVAEAFGMLQSHTWDETETTGALELLTELYLEHTKCALDYFPREDVRNGALDQALEQQRQAAAATMKTRPRLMHLVGREGIEWLSDNHGTAHRIGRALLSSLPDVADRWVPEVLRANAINAGTVSDEAALRDVVAAIDAWRDSHQPDPATEVFVLEGLARGAARFDLDNSLDTLDKAWDLRDANASGKGHSALRFVQLARTEGLVREQNRARLDTHTDRLLRDALDLAEANDYVRYITSIRELLAAEIA
jgi:transcriptional regulator with XRE-family HTH domain